MKALCFRGGRVQMEQHSIPAPEQGEVRVRVRRAGVCNTDLEIVRGYMGFEGTLGHEWVGEVVSPGPWEGRRVCADINLACGACTACEAGDPHHCPRRQVFGIAAKDGVFAEYVTLPERNLVEVPEDLSDDAAVFAEPLAAAFEIAEQTDVAGERTLVLGDGKLGILCAWALAHRGAEVTLAGRHARKLALASAGGVRTADVAQRPLEEHGFDLVVEATGSAQGLGEALERVRPRGTVVLKSTFAGTPEVNTNKLVIDEIRLLGSRCGPIDEALAAMGTGAIDPTPLVDARYPLSEGVEAMEHAARRGTLKVLLEP